MKEKTESAVLELIFKTNLIIPEGTYLPNIVEEASRKETNPLTNVSTNLSATYRGSGAAHVCDSHNAREFEVCGFVLKEGERAGFGKVLDLIYKKGLKSNLGGPGIAMF